MPYKWWEWSDAEEKQKKDAENFLANAQQQRQQADHAELQQHVGGILEGFQNDVSQRMQSWMPQARAAPQPDPVAQAIEVARAPSPPAEPAAPQPSIIDQALDAGRGFVAKAADAASTAGHNLVGNADNALTAASTAMHNSPIAPAIDTALEYSGVNAAQGSMQRQREIGEQSNAEGFAAGALDPSFRRAHPDVADEYDSLQQQKAVGAIGQGPAGVVHGAMNAAGHFVPQAAAAGGNILAAVFGGGGRAANAGVVRGPAQQTVAATYGHATPAANLGLSSWTEKLFDSLRPLGQAADELSKQMGGKLGLSEDAYKLARLANASKDIAGEWFNQGPGRVLHPQNLESISGSVAQGRADLNDYLRAADAVDKAAVLGTPNRNFGGMNAAQAQDALTEIEKRLGPQNYAALEQSAKAFHDFGHELLDRKVQAGLVTPALAQQLKTQYPRYMPINIIDHLDAVASQRITGPVGTIGGAVNDIKALTQSGTARSAETPLEAYYRQSERTSYLIARQEVANAVIDTAKNGTMLQGLVRPGDNVAAQRMGMPTTGTYQPRAQGEEILKVFNQGVPMTFYVDKAIDPLINLSVKTGDGLVYRGLSGTANLVRKASVGYNPVWGLKQVMMDSLTFLVKEGGITNPGAFKHLATGLDEAGLNPFRGAGGKLTLNPLQGFKQGALRNEAAAAGALPGTVEHMTGKPGSYSKAIDALTGEMTSPQKFFTFVKGINERFDAAPRLAEYSLKKSEGLGAREAALHARDITIDPSRGGRWTRDVNTIIPFFNVAFQGAAYAPRLLMNPETRNRAGTGIVSSVMIPAALLELSNQQDPRYKDVPDFDKNRGLVIMAPFGRGHTDPASGQEKPNYFLVRTGPFTPFVLLAREMINRSQGNGGDALKLAAGIATSASPIPAGGLLEAAAGQRDPLKAGGAVVANMLPPVAKIGLEAATNKDFFRDQPIIPQGLENAPPEQQYTNRTSATAKAIGQGLAHVTNGRLAMSPAIIDHMLTSWGGLSQAAVGGTDALGNVATAGIKDLTGYETGFGNSGDSQRLTKLRRDIAQSGLSDEKRAEIQNEIDREEAITADQQSSFQNKPVVGPLVSSLVGYREGGSQSLDDRTKAADMALVEKKRDQGATGKELARQGKSFSDVTGDIRGVKLTRAQQADYRENALAYRTRLIDDLMKSDIYKSSDDVSRKRLIDDVMERGAGWASQEVLPGRSETGREFVTSEVGADIENAAPRYIKSLTDAAELDKLRATQRFRNVDAKDYAQVSADVAKMQQYQQVLGKYEARMVLTNEIGAERMAKAMNANENPRWQSTLADFRRTHPDYELFVGSQPRTMTQHGLAPAAVARLAGLGR